MTTFSIAFDLLRQALLRKWFLGLGLVITLGLVFLGFSLRMDVVDGALAGMRLFGSVVSRDIVAADLALRPIFEAATYIIFYGFTAFLLLACSDFAPKLLAPGRIEHLLALPVRRFELIAGTYLGVLALGGIAALYGATGMVVVLGVKTGVWTALPMVAALLGSVAFATLYAAMVATAVVVRSAALSTAVGGLLFILGIIAGQRETFLPLLERGVGRSLFAGVTLLVPRISTLGQACAHLASARPVSAAALASLLAGFFLFAAGSVALAAWLFDRKDF